MLGWVGGHRPCEPKILASPREPVPGNKQEPAEHGPKIRPLWEMFWNYFTYIGAAGDGWWADSVKPKGDTRTAGCPKRERMGALPVRFRQSRHRWMARRGPTQRPRPPPARSGRPPATEASARQIVRRHLCTRTLRIHSRHSKKEAGLGAPCSCSCSMPKTAWHGDGQRPATKSGVWRWSALL